MSCMQVLYSELVTLLYALLKLNNQGTRLGDILHLGLEKLSCTTVWNSSVERSEFADEDASESAIVIRKMQVSYYFNPQYDLLYICFCCFRLSLEVATTAGSLN